MLELAKQTIKYFLENNKIPKIEELEIKNEELLSKKWMIFVTLYKNWEIVWSSWNIVEIEKTLASEIISNTIEALNDKRFEKLKIEDLENIKIRIDIVKERVVLDENTFKWINPVKNWIIAIKKDYNKLCVILPNISSSIFTSDDLLPVLSKKLWDEFNFSDFIVYSLDTEVLRDF